MMWQLNIIDNKYEMLDCWYFALNMEKLKL